MSDEKSTGNNKIDEFLRLVKKYSVKELLNLGFYSVSYRETRCVIQGNLKDIDIDASFIMKEFKPRIDDSYTTYWEKTYFNDSININITLVA